MLYQHEIQLRTKGHRDIHDITDAVAEIIDESKVTTGTVNIFNVGSTACVGTIEFEPGLEKDISEVLDKLIPPSKDYGHEMAWHDGNGHSHLQATIMGPSLTVPISRGQMCLGTWQQIFLLECDVKPRDRAIIVTIMGS